MRRLARSLVFVLLACPLYAQQPAADVTPVRIESKVLGETRTALVRLPPSYRSGAHSYPVLYMSDGEANMGHTAMTIDFLTRNGRMPEVIIVGINNTDRTRDLTPTHLQDMRLEGTQFRFPTSGGADKFLAFIETELIPQIEANYRTQPFRVFAGHSFGGLFAMHSLFSRPRLFNAWIAVSPTLGWDNNWVFRQAEQFVKNNRNLDRTLYLTIGDEGAELDHEFNRLQTLLRRQAPKGFESTLVRMADEDHGSILLPTHFAGLKKVFEPWRFVIARDADATKLFSAARAHFAKLSTRLGYAIPVPEPTTNVIGYRLLQAGLRREAIEVFKANVESYPQSANVYDSLAEAYEGSGELALARENYARAAELGKKAGDPNTQIYERNRDRVATALSSRPG
jgi:predicted alpha/beta superfamily hydrolase